MADREDRSANLIVILGIILLSVVILVRSPLMASYWLDETISTWVTSATYADVISRTDQYQGQSPFYYILLFAYRHFIDGSELIVRLPSVVLILLGSVFSYAAFRELTRSSTAWIATLFLCTSDPILKAAFSARPYGLAFFFASLSTFLLLKYFKTEGRLSLVAYAVAFTAMVYAHYLFGVIALLHLGIVCVMKPDLLFRVILAWIGVAALSLPALSQLISLANRRAELSFALSPKLIDLANGIISTPVALYILVGVGIGILNRANFDRSRFSPTQWRVALIWIASGPIIFFLVSLLGSGSLWVDRYWLWQVPGVALFAGMILDSLKLGTGRKIAMICVVALMMFRESGRQWVTEGWREAVQTINQEASGSPLLVYTGLIESEKIDNFANEKTRAYLLSPLQTYPIVNHTAQPIPSASNLDYIEKNAIKDLKSSILVLALETPKWSGGETNLRKLMEDRGYNTEIDKRFWPVKILKFTPAVGQAPQNTSAPQAVAP